MSKNNIAKMQQVKSIRDIDIKGKRVLIRVDFNVPMDKDFNISDDTRIREALPTINYCIDSGVKSIVLVSHLGRPKARSVDFSLKHIIKRLERLLNRNIIFADSIESAKRELDSNGKDSKIILLENIRFEPGETKNDTELSKKLASLCDVYVNDAFGTSHRAHASTYGIAKFVSEKVAGILLKKEIDSFAKVIQNPLRPLLLIVGGSKVSSKLSLLQRVLDVVDKIIIGGAMSNTFLESLGFNMQKSLVERDLIPEATKILNLAREKNVKVYLPVDIVSSDNIDNPKDIKISPAQDVPENHIAVDIGPASVKLFSEVVGLSQTIIWNGPLGVYEIHQFSRGTFNIANAIANTYAFSFIGGGDTADAIDKAGQRDNMSFISTGGGASLELLEGNVLPAFEVLDRKE
ncbi:phosphoglycerate kinase [Helicobacter saguini]|uniref:Phosphoglycerate kinase n=1 Tax=Helicobacter saguini TaxID=1548018 RepID=A0A347VMX1_9HELI|nr:phosphoglycerate kinase [Helicobacter saguini]MWV61991.1 phosphoglycerate kinase [Helicobacter saguini]MWV67335.1 phosphoglycerate kinase [Helicobacter saguini]MWV69686.1 phosphoglycerate kinase [Helicobacter saguini]MWV73096.1 phosphoglycerate kinase [Helicobacter saguini]TLD95536.1 phosphoglycerate kinase [Helicobacter saguini]